MSTHRWHGHAWVDIARLQVTEATSKTHFFLSPKQTVSGTDMYHHANFTPISLTVAKISVTKPDRVSDRTDRKIKRIAADITSDELHRVCRQLSSPVTYKNCSYYCAPLYWSGAAPRFWPTPPPPPSSYGSAAPDTGTQYCSIETVLLTLHGHIKTAKQRNTIQQCGDCYTGRR